MEEFEEKFIKPIVNASYPATLAGLDLAVLQFSTSPGLMLNYTLLAGAMGFLLSAFSVFSYTIYPTRKKLWTSSALSFIAGLFCSILAVVLLILKPVIGNISQDCEGPTAYKNKYETDSLAGTEGSGFAG